MTAWYNWITFQFGRVVCLTSEGNKTPSQIRIFLALMRKKYIYRAQDESKSCVYLDYGNVGGDWHSICLFSAGMDLIEKADYYISFYYFNMQSLLFSSKLNMNNKDLRNHYYGFIIFSSIFKISDKNHINHLLIQQDFNLKAILRQFL